MRYTTYPFIDDGGDSGTEHCGDHVSDCQTQIHQTTGTDVKAILGLEETYGRVMRVANIVGRPIRLPGKVANIKKVIPYMLVERSRCIECERRIGLTKPCRDSR